MGAVSQHHVGFIKKEMKSDPVSVLVGFDIKTSSVFIDLTAWTVCSGSHVYLHKNSDSEIF